MNETMQAERSYIAFISYRHTPLDREAAERVQKKIENYVVPKEFRGKVGGKKLGLCFRDEDELPASSSLTDSIYYALDHTKFLIVICTPNLPLSKWCEAEIRYFLKKHDRDHVLAVLADGTPDESFSPYMLHDFDEEGNITKDWEPLAANIAGPNHTINNKTFKKEIVRLYAALIGCPFDELWQRERRARTNRLLSLAGAAVAVMAIFLGVVLNRNAKIEAQNSQILAQNDQITKQYDQIQEQNSKIEEQNLSLQAQLSAALVDSGLTKLKNHDLRGALQDGVNALESDDPAIYDHRAASLLAGALGAYNNQKVQSRLVYEQTLSITNLAVTDDEKHAVFKDLGGTLSCIDLEEYNLQWQISTGDKNTVLYTENLKDRILYKSESGVYCHDLSDGSLLWSYTHQEYCNNYFQALSEDGTIFAVADHFGNDYYNPDNPVYVLFLNTEDGSEIGRCKLERDGIELELSTVISKPKGYAADFSDDNKTFACVLSAEEQTTGDSWQYVDAIFAVNLNTFKQEASGILSHQMNLLYGMDVSSGGKSIYLAGYTLSYGGICTILYTKEDSKYSSKELISDHALRGSGGYDDSSFLSNDCHFLSNGRRAVVISDDDMFIFDQENNTLLRGYAMNDTITNAYWKDSKKTTYEIAVSDGNIKSYVLGRTELFSHAFSLDPGFDQSDFICALPLNKGMIDNARTGMYLSVGGDEQNHILLARIVTDPNLETFEFKKPKNFSILEHFLLLPGSDLAFYLYYPSGAFSFNKRTGQWKKSAAYDTSFGLLGALVLDEEHFVCDDQIYGLDGSVSLYGEPFFPESTSPVYPSWHVRLNDGTILSWNEYSYYDLGFKYPSQDDEGFGDVFGAFPNLCLLWRDGKPLSFSSDPEKALMLRDDWSDFDFSRSVYSVGSNQMVLGYGQRITLEDNHLAVAEEKAVHFLDPVTGEITTIADPYPDSQKSTIIMGNKDPLAAMLYSDGKLCIYRADTKEVTEPDAVYKANEITAIAFSEKDEYLVVVTSMGRLDIYETASWTRLFSRTIDAFREYITDSDGTIHSISAVYSADRSRLIVESSIHTCLILDPESWTIDSTIQDILAYDAETNRFFLQGDGVDILTLPFYTKDDLKEWAISELN